MSSSMNFLRRLSWFLPRSLPQVLHSAHSVDLSSIALVSSPPLPLEGTSLPCCRKVHLAELTCICHKSLAPPYLTSHFCLPTHHHNTKTKNLVNLPIVRMTFGQHAFKYAGASLWHSLPASLRESGFTWPHPDSTSQMSVQHCPGGSSSSLGDYVDQQEPGVWCIVAFPTPLPPLLHSDLVLGLPRLTTGHFQDCHCCACTNVDDLPLQ